MKQPPPPTTSPPFRHPQHRTPKATNRHPLAPHGRGHNPVKPGLHQGIDFLFSAAGVSLLNRSFKVGLTSAIALIINYLSTPFGLAFTGWQVSESVDY